MALDYINKVRARAGLAPTTFTSYAPEYATGSLQPIDLILDERARELYAEGHRWMDLRRTKRLIDYNVKYNSGVESAENFLGADGQYRWFRPFPQDEINLNEGITDDDQNPGYKTSK